MRRRAKPPAAAADGPRYGRPLSPGPGQALGLSAAAAPAAAEGAGSALVPDAGRQLHPGPPGTAGNQALAGRRSAHAAAARDVRPDGPAAHGRRSRGLRAGQFAQRVCQGRRSAAGLAASMASAGLGTGSTWPAMPTPRATSSPRTAAIRTPTPIAITWCGRSTKTCPSTASCSNSWPPTSCRWATTTEPWRRWAF